ncbi:MAG: cysteine methyltransferase [Acidobacteria bacterium]|nr:MAG: cysteine methyltransferase [Acidobacteriota bacterium]
MIWHAYAPAPIGNLLLIADEEGLLRIEFPPASPPDEVSLDEERLMPVIRQIGEFFAGRRKTFDVRIALRGTAFQLEVWRALLCIPYGETRSYAEIAKSIGRPTATRAVGAANGANPIPIIVPCHRVIGSNGSLTGFGGGIDVKRWLLNFEARSF